MSIVMTCVIVHARYHDLTSLCLFTIIILLLLFFISVKAAHNRHESNTMPLSLGSDEE